MRERTGNGGEEGEGYICETGGTRRRRLKIRFGIKDPLVRTRLIENALALARSRSGCPCELVQHPIITSHPVTNRVHATRKWKVASGTDLSAGPFWAFPGSPALRPGFSRRPNCTAWRRTTGTRAAWRRHVCGCDRTRRRTTSGSGSVPTSRPRSAGSLRCGSSRMCTVSVGGRGDPMSC